MNTRLARLTLGAALWSAAGISALAGNSSGVQCGPPAGPPWPTSALGPAQTYAHLPDDCLKSMYLQCATAAEQNRLDPAAAMACSADHEVLLKRVFFGDFNAMLTWWRSTRPRSGQ